jgi:hypothetical protein
MPTSGTTSVRAVVATRAPAAVLAAVLAVVLATAACGASLPTSSERSAAETATAVCGLLRGWSNEMVASLNTTSDAITADDDPETANDVLLDGYDDLIAIAEGHVGEVDDLDLPASGDRDQLVDDLRAGAEAAVAELEDERSELEDLAPITVDDQRGVLGGAFTSLEKAQSVVEPQIVTYDDEAIRTAFAADPTCEHVVQAF